jgi:D-glycero-D-manno-heptose 1,7-bisphosphate phosphatase
MGASPFTARAARIRTCFLDRDGVLNRKMPEGRYVTNWSEFDVLPGVVEAIRSLNEAGVRVIVVSNQRGIAKGLYSGADVEDLHARFQALLQASGAHIDGFYFCPHEKTGCNCRKPRTGMFDQARHDFPEIDAASSAMIGDSLADIEFGRNLGMMTILMDGDMNHERPGTEQAAALADLRVASMPQAVAALLGFNQ